jgi:hypothetical protein
MILVLSYIGYILLMYFNEKIEGFFLALEVSIAKWRRANKVFPLEEEIGKREGERCKVSTFYTTLIFPAISLTIKEFNSCFSNAF